MHPEPSMAQNQVLERKPAELDYKLVFDLMPGMCLVLDPSFKIVAQNAEHAHATLTVGRDVIGRGVFEVFPDNPNNPNANGVSALRQSLLNVLRTRAADVMPIIRYDIQPPMGAYEVRYWAVINSPIIGNDGFVQWIINRADDVTHLVERSQQQTH
jgi:PAS domain-containing protein